MRARSPVYEFMALFTRRVSKHVWTTTPSSSRLNRISNKYVPEWGVQKVGTITVQRLNLLVSDAMMRPVIVFVIVATFAAFLSSCTSSRSAEVPAAQAEPRQLTQQI